MLRLKKIERRLDNIEKAIAGKLECTEVEFRPCPFPEFARALIEALQNSESSRELGDKLEKLMEG